MKIAGAALLVGLGLGLGYLVADHPAPPPARAVAVETPSRAPVRVVHYNAPALPQPAAIDRATEDAPAQNDRASRIVDDATARGMWTEADREALNAELEPLPGPTKAEIVARVADAVNRGTLRLTTELPL